MNAQCSRMSRQTIQQAIRADKRRSSEARERGQADEALKYQARADAAMKLLLGR